MKNYSTYFFDLDGTLIKSNRVLLGVNEILSLLKQEKKDVYILTNYPVRSPQMLQHDLAQLGLKVSIEQMITPFLSVKHYFRGQKKPISIYVAGSEQLLHELQLEDLSLIQKAEQASDQTFVVLGMDSTITYSQLQEAFFILQKGAQLILLNPDLHGPSDKGLLLDTGSLGNLFSGYTPIKKLIVMGKPAVPMQEVMSNLIQDKKETLIVGDSLRSDISIGRELGIDTVLFQSEVSAVEIHGC